MTADPKPGHRREIVDPRVGRIHLASHPECAACGGRGSNAAHVIARGDGGDDVVENFITLCGSGTSGCHGAYHGSPYEPGWVVAERTPLGGWTKAALAARGIPWPPPTGWRRAQLRDRAWVVEQIGRHIKGQRPDTIEYVLWKLGEIAGRHYLWFHYAIAYPVDADAARAS